MTLVQRSQYLNRDSARITKGHVLNYHRWRSRAPLTQHHRAYLTKKETDHDSTGCDSTTRTPLRPPGSGGSPSGGDLPGAGLHRVLRNGLRVRAAADADTE